MAACKLPVWNHVLGRRLGLLPALWEGSWVPCGTQSLCSTAKDSAQTASDAAAAAAGGPLQPGAVLSASRRFSAEDVTAFTSLTGDSNPIHTSSAAAAAAGLPGTLLPGLLLASLFPAIIGSHFPGALYLTQTLKFKRHALVRADLMRRACLRVCSLPDGVWRVLQAVWQRFCKDHDRSSMHACHDACHAATSMRGAAIVEGPPSAPAPAWGPLRGPQPSCATCVCVPHAARARPARCRQVGDAVVARLTVERCSGSRVSFHTLCLSSASGEALVEGTALALLRSVPAATAAPGAVPAPTNRGPAGERGADNK